MARHRIDMHFDIDLVAQNDAEAFMVKLREFLTQVKPLPEPQPNVGINPVPDDEPIPSGQIAPVEKKLIVPGRD